MTNYFYTKSGDYYIPIKIRMPDNRLKDYSISPSTEPSEIYKILAPEIEQEIKQRYKNSSEAILNNLKTAEDFSQHFVKLIESKMDNRIQKVFTDVQNEARRGQRAAQKVDQKGINSALEQLDLLLCSPLESLKDGDEIFLDPKIYGDIEKALQGGKKPEDLQGFVTAKLGDYFEELLAKFINNTEQDIAQSLFATTTGRQKVRFNEKTKFVSRKVDIEVGLTETPSGAQEVLGINAKGQFPKSAKARTPISKYFQTDSKQMQQYSGWTAELVNFLAYRRIALKMTATDKVARQIGAANSSMAIGGFTNTTKSGTGSQVNDRALFIVTGNKVESLAQKLRNMQNDKSVKGSLHMRTEISDVSLITKTGKKDYGVNESPESKNAVYYMLKRRSTLSFFNIKFLS
jgi:hypothetical protein